VYLLERGFIRPAGSADDAPEAEHEEELRLASRI